MIEFKRLLSMTIAIVMLITVLVGCDGGEDLPGYSDNNSTEIANSSPTETNGSGQPYFDWMEEAFQNIYLFGHGISLPGTVAEWGEDFSINEEIMFSEEGTDI
ncbi:MAG: hypothetical protein LBC86_10035, partial [Oscillospiraceae bacterium]|nr:hypothetical protein [Oscillospiraceae bacterium]